MSPLELPPPLGERGVTLIAFLHNIHSNWISTEAELIIFNLIFIILNTNSGSYPFLKKSNLLNGFFLIEQIL